MRRRHWGFPGFRVSRVYWGLFYELQIESWIMKVFLGLINDTPKKKKKKEGEPFFPLLFKKLTSWPAAWSRVGICLPFLRIVEDENAERSESIFIWRRNRWQPLTEWRLTRPDSSSMMKWSSAIALFFFFPSSFHCLHLSLTLLLSHLFCHTHARFHAQTFLSIWLLLITAL